ncbi:MAG: hypothetical protein V2B19_20855 [Pseudomonadota bacterium]
MVTKVRHVFLAILLITLISGGCRTYYVVRSNPAHCIIDNEYFTAKLSPAGFEDLGYGWSCDSLVLHIKNKTNKNIEVNWNKKKVNGDR